MSVDGSLENIAPQPALRPTVQTGGWQRVSVRVLIGMLVSASFTVLVLRDIRWHDLAAAFRHAHIAPLVASLILFGAANAGIAVRWRLLLHNDRVDFHEAFAVLNIGLLCNVVLPARGGDVVRAVFLRQRRAIPLTTGLASIFLEKLGDVAVLVVFFVPSMFWIAAPRWLMLSTILAVIAVIAGMILCVALVRHWFDRPLIAAARYVPTRLRHRASTAVRAVRASILLLGTGNNLVTFALLSVAIWAANAVGAFFVLSSLGIPNVPFGAAFAIIAIMNLGLIVPSSPGAVGTYEFLGLAALALFGTAREPALGFAIMMHMLTLLIVLVFGAASMAHLGYSLRASRRAAAIRQ
jgi:uncharacterized protein (TIRG00374 family)